MSYNKTYQDTTKTVKFRVAGVDEQLAQFKGLPLEARKLLKQATFQVADDLATAIRQAAERSGEPHAAELGATVKARKTARVGVVAGGRTKVFEDGVPAGFTILGSEFGGKGHGFTWKGAKHSEWFYTTAQAHYQEVTERWKAVTQSIVDSYGTDGTVS